MSVYYRYPDMSTKASTENLSKSGLDNNSGFVSWHNTENKSVTSEPRSNFDLSDSRVWESLTSISAPKSDNTKTLIKPPLPSYGASTKGPGQGGRFDRLDTKQLSNSPGTRIKGRGQGNYDKKDFPYNTDDEVSETMAKQQAPRGHLSSFKGNNADKKGVFVNPDKDGYMYDYDHVKELEGDGKEKGKTQDFATELQNAIRKSSLRRKSENQTDSDGAGAQSSESVNESSAFNSTTAINKETDKDTSGPDAQSSPRPKKKKRKNSKERKSPKSSRKQKSGEGGEDSPQKSPKAKPRKSLNLEDSENVPPEAYAPIFSGDEEPSTSMDYSYQYQPGYQGNVPGAPFDPRYPMGPYQPGMMGMYPPGMPYQQAGQAQWYVEANPNGQHKMAFAMQTHSHSDDSLQGGGPGYTSTPYAPGHGSSALVPAGTILDDPQVPKPGTSVMRYDEDPLSGIKTSQVIWTDAKKDPTDPPPDSATQITRKTITRVTTRSTENQLTEAPNPSK